MSSYNHVTILGHLGRDPDHRLIGTGDSQVCELSIATSERWTDRSGNEHERTEWHRVKIWGRAAAACDKHLEKGSQVLVTGSLRTESWEDREGIKRYRTIIVADPRGGVRFVGRPKSERSERTDRAPSESDEWPEGRIDDVGDEIPF